jgi:hypothetical protein
VKPKHVLVNKEGEVKLCDFDDSKILELGKHLKNLKPKSFRIKNQLIQRHSAIFTARKMRKCPAL